jgi:hypothetical protein
MIFLFLSLHLLRHTGRTAQARELWWARTDRCSAGV